MGKLIEAHQEHIRYAAQLAKQVDPQHFDMFDVYGHLKSAIRDVVYVSARKQKSFEGFKARQEILDEAVSVLKEELKENFESSSIDTFTQAIKADLLKEEQLFGKSVAGAVFQDTKQSPLRNEDSELLFDQEPKTMDAKSTQKIADPLPPTGNISFARSMESVFQSIKTTISEMFNNSAKTTEKSESASRLHPKPLPDTSELAGTQEEQQQQQGPRGL